LQEYSYTLYDTAVFGTTALTNNALFAVAQGGDATHDKSFTNSRGAGQLPTQESFEANWLGVYSDASFTQADLLAMWHKSVCEIRVGDFTVFQAPLRQIAAYNAHGGIYTQAAAANAANIGLVGMGWDLAIPIAIPGGTAFVVNILQGTALSAASQNVKFLMSGTLTRQ
jgi:hypothetical protein